MSALRAITGEQFVIGSGTARAVLTEVGAGLREFTVDDVPYVETFGTGTLPPKGSGAILVPWPNRVAGGRWAHGGRRQQLALTEPAAGNAIHGLGRFLSWRPVADTAAPADTAAADTAAAADRASGAAPSEGEPASAITLRAVLNAQPGWPVPIEASVRYQVGDDGLRVTHSMRNLGAESIPFGIGAHPYPRAGRSDTDDCTLRLAASTVLPLDAERMTPSGEPTAVDGAYDFRVGRGLVGVELDTPFGGCVPADGDDLVRHTIAGPGGGVEVWAEPVFRWVQVFTPADFPGRGRAVAVEPMTCPPDALNSGVDLIDLAPGETWTASWGLRPLVS